MPEFFLTGIQTETLIREIAPITTYLNGFASGRDVAPTGGGSPPAMWVTETGMDTNDLDLTPPYVVATPAQADHVHAKAALRTYVSFIGKGIQAVDLYAVDDYPSYNLVDPAFFTAAQNGTTGTYTYPGTASGGAVMDATRRLAATLAGAQTITTPRPLSLLGIASDSDAYQFAGNGTASFPPLYDRELLFFQPFQLTSHSWVAATYVMTRNIGTDLAPENFQITIGGLDGDNLTASATDPLTGNTVAVQIIARDGDDATIQLPVTDSPEMVTLDDSSPAPGAVAPVAADANPFDALVQPLAIPALGHDGSQPKASPPALEAVSTIVRKGRAVYLRVKCTKACSVHWSLASGNAGGKKRRRHPRRSLAANRATEHPSSDGRVNRPRSRRRDRVPADRRRARQQRRSSGASPSARRCWLSRLASGAAGAALALIRPRRAAPPRVRCAGCRGPARSRRRGSAPSRRCATSRPASRRPRRGGSSPSSR